MKYRRALPSDIASFLRANPSSLALDTETTGLNPRKDTLLDIVLANREEAIIFSAEHRDALLGAKQLFIMHNAKFDLAFLHHNGVTIPAENVFDTMLMDHLRDENSPHGLDHIIKTRWNDNYKELFWARFKNYEDADDEAKVAYACKDAIYTYRLFEHLEAELQVPWSLVLHVHKLAAALYDTEIRGVKIDLEYLNQMESVLKLELDTLYECMRSSVADEIQLIELGAWNSEIQKRKTPAAKLKVPYPVFNFASNKQLQELLYGKLGLPIQRNKKRKPTVDDAALEKLEKKHFVVEMLRKYRELSKVLGTYVTGMKDRVEDGRIYPSFKINGTVTGRISSENPNLHNLPRNGAVRGIFVPDDGYKMFSSDFGALEVVIEAHFTQDKNLLRIINDGLSKHDITAEALGIDRQTAKTINFAAQYQCSPRKFAEILKIGQKEAEDVFNRYWDTYSGVRAVYNDCCKAVDSGQPIINLFGRKRHFPTDFDVAWMRDAAHRQAYSALIQGSGADIAHMAYYMVHEELKRTGYGGAIFGVHDQVIIQAKVEYLDEASKILHDVMNSVGELSGLSVPLTADLQGPWDRFAK